MIDVHASATSHLNHLARGDYTAAELLEAHFDQIDRHDGNVRALVWQDRDAARRIAASVQGRPDETRPLLGLSITVKESFNVTGAPTTWGIPAFRDNIATSDAVTVERFRAAGAIVFGKTNVPENLADWQSYNPVYGTTNNPWNLERSPGGSSGGSGASLASGFAALELGSDIGGSIRNPAHFNGVFGHKPTWGLIPSRGHALPPAIAEPDIAVVGPLARSAFDLELALDVLARPDLLDKGMRYELKGLPYRNLGRLRVGVWANDEICQVSRETESRVRKVADALAQSGAIVNYEARPDFTAQHNHDVYTALLWSFMAVGFPDEQYNQLKAAAAQIPEGANDPASRMPKILTLSHRDWIRYNNMRDYLRWAWHRFFQNYDILLAPQSSTAAFPHDHSPPEQRILMVDGKSQDYMQQIFWAGITGISRLPSTVIPTGVGAEGLPIGVQIVGNAWDDRLTIQVAQELERRGFAFTPPPAMRI